VMTDDGREVLLKDDGTWEFRSTDRYANTKEGARIRLKANKSWEYIGNAPVTSKQHVRTTTLDIKLQKVEIEVYKEKVHRNIRTFSQTVFYVSIDVTPLAKKNLTTGKIDISRILARDDKGGNYRVLSTTPAVIDFSDKTRLSISIRLDGSPSVWGNAKSMELELLPDIFGIQESITLSQNINEIDKIRVEGFDNIE